MRTTLMAAIAAAAFGTTLAVTGTASAAPASTGNAVAERQAAGPLVSYAQLRRRVVVTRRVGGPYYGYRGGAGVAAGVIGGLAAGALIGGAIAAQQPAPVYVAPGPAYAAPGGDAVEYCMQRYQSYDPQSGTFLGYDGLRHPCP
jgi:hypothetical protein